MQGKRSTFLPLFSFSPRCPADGSSGTTGAAAVYPLAPPGDTREGEKKQQKNTGAEPAAIRQEEKAQT